MFRVMTSTETLNHAPRTCTLSADCEQKEANTSPRSLQCCIFVRLCLSSSDTRTLLKVDTTLSNGFLATIVPVLKFTIPLATTINARFVSGVRRQPHLFTSILSNRLHVSSSFFRKKLCTLFPVVTDRSRVIGALQCSPSDVSLR